MKRAIYRDLLKWKNDPDKKPLILFGARQVGKTWILKEFGKNEYENLVYINCDNNKVMMDAFEDYDTERIIRAMVAYSGCNIKPGKTLIFLDEIQEIPNALTSLKYFQENAPEYHIVVAGSLLGIGIHEGTGFPVGKVDELRLYPMSFQEFLIAMGEDNLCEYMESQKFQDISILRQKLTELLRQYYFVGGMPEIVASYIKDKDTIKVRKIQKKILNNYKEDFSKHVPKDQISKVNLVWESIPSQLAKENKKYLYGALKKGSRAKEYENAIQWLIDAGLVYKVNRVNKIELPLNFYEDKSAFKLFACDLGLLGAMAEAPAKEILIGDNGFKEYKGAFTEQYVAQTLITEQITPKYYTKDSSRLEIDFVVQLDKVYPIEVKAEENLKSKSLKNVVGENLIGWRFSMSDYREQEQLINIPLYSIQEWIRRNKENYENQQYRIREF